MTDKGPLSPAELFSRLMQGNYKQIQCVDEASEMQGQRKNLILCIANHRQQINIKMSEFNKLQELVQIRNNLRIELEKLRSDRIAIDNTMATQIQRIKITNLQITDLTHQRTSIEDIRQQNIALQMKFRQLAEYALRIERHNSLLQQEKRMSQADTRIRSTSEYNYFGNGLNWRERAKGIKIEQSSMEQSIIYKLREKEEQSLRKAQMQEQQIHERNRRRMSSFSERVRKRF